MPPAKGLKLVSHISALDREHQNALRIRGGVGVISGLGRDDATPAPRG